MKTLEDIANTSGFSNASTGSIREALENFAKPFPRSERPDIVHPLLADAWSELEFRERYDILTELGFRHMETSECLYCGAEVLEDDIIPDVSHDDEWRRLEDAHFAGCEWIETRAHRIV